MTTYNLREASKHGVPTPRDGYEQRKVLYKKYNAAVIKGWSKRVDDGVEYTDKDFILCERLIVQHFPEGGVIEVPENSVLAVIDLDKPIDPQIEELEEFLVPPQTKKKRVNKSTP